MFCNDRSLTIRINEQYNVCPREDGYINIGRNYTGYLLCPDYYLLSDRPDSSHNNMFDFVDKHITTKENIIYDYTQVNATIQIIEINETGVYFGKGYEESENGFCPINCGQCNDLKQCYKCKNTTPYYIGVRENYLNPSIALR